MWSVQRKHLVIHRLSSNIFFPSSELQVLPVVDQILFTRFYTHIHTYTQWRMHIRHWLYTLPYEKKIAFSFVGLFFLQSSQPLSFMSSLFLGFFLKFNFLFYSRQTKWILYFYLILDLPAHGQMLMNILS